MLRGRFDTPRTLWRSYEVLLRAGKETVRNPQLLPLAGKEIVRNAVELQLAAPGGLARPSVATRGPTWPLVAPRWFVVLDG